VTKTLLINWVYYPPTGHVIEALRIARDVAAADPDLRVSILLNARAPVELATCVSSVDRVFSIDVERTLAADALPSDLSRKWDFVLTDPRALTASGWRDLDRFHEMFREWVHGRRVSPEDPNTMLPRVFQPLRLELPDEARAFAAAALPGHASPLMSVLPGAASQMRAPSMRFWTAFLDAFFERHPEGCVVLLGRLRGRGLKTRGVSIPDIERLRSRYGSIYDAFDVPILNQLALAERCQLHVSPHSGFSFAVQSVGVPWLALAAQEWPEFILNGVPMVSVYPECPLYPCFREMYADCRNRIRRGDSTPCISDEAMLPKLPAITSAMEALLDRAVDYRQAAEAHERELRRRVGPGLWTVLDWPAVIADDYRF
jgi:hypothetical protein